jgi:hypothetical protein
VSCGFDAEIDSALHVSMMVLCKLLNDTMQKCIIKSDVIRQKTSSIFCIVMIKKCIAEKKGRGSKPFELDLSPSASSAETSERSSSALISAFDFSCGIEQSANALSPLSLHVLHRKKTKKKISNIKH